jgi:hypothetical protein
MVRCIVFSNETGSREGVYFTEEPNIDVEDIVPLGCSVDHDFFIEDPFPSSFPFDYCLER